jgi:hypothetical protein
MNKSILRQCASLKREYADEERRIQKMEAEIQAMAPDCKEVTDVVTRGKRGKKPLGTCTIRGNEDNTQINRKRARLRERKAKQELKLVRIENMILDVEDYINDVPDSETRRMMRFFFIEEMTWNEVAEAMGEGYTGEACKKKVQREMGKI